MTILSLDNNSTQLDIENFEKKIKDGKWIIRYHADWCYHCKKMTSDWKKFESDNSDYNIASVEETAIKKLTQKPNNLLGFPSIHLSNNGKFIKELDGDRSLDNFRSFYNSYQQSGGRKKKSTKINKKNRKNKKKTLRK